MLKTLQLGLHWFPENQGGLDRVYYELSRVLPAAGIGFRGLIAGSSRSANETDNAIQAFAPSDASIVTRWRGLRRNFSHVVREDRPDLIVSHFALYTLPIMDKLRNLPMVVHFHGPWADEGSVEGNSGLRYAAKKNIEGLVYRRAVRAIVLSNAFAEVLAARYRFPENRIHIIPGGVDLRRFATGLTRQELRARLNWPQDRPTLIAVRRLVPRMGLENLISAVSVIRQQIPQLQLMIAGRGPLQAELTQQIAALGLTENIKMLGFVSEEDLPLIYGAADLSIVPTVALEGFGLIAAESLAAGTPCLVSPVGGLPEVVSALSPDMILASPAPADIAKAVLAVFKGELNLPDGPACRAFAAASFDWSIIAARIAEVYRLAVA